MTRNTTMICGAILLVLVLVCMPPITQTVPTATPKDISPIVNRIASPTPTPTPSPLSSPHSETVEDPHPQTCYEDLDYNETTYENVCEFLSMIPVDPSYHSCSLHARHIAFEAQAHGLEVGTCVICPAHTSGVMSGHEINFFWVGGKEYYNINKNANDFRNVFTYKELVHEINEWKDMNIVTLSIRDRWYPQQ